MVDFFKPSKPYENLGWQIIFTCFGWLLGSGSHRGCPKHWLTSMNMVLIKETLISMFYHRNFRICLRFKPESLPKQITQPKRQKIREMKWSFFSGILAVENRQKSTFRDREGNFWAQIRILEHFLDKMKYSKLPLLDLGLNGRVRQNPKQIRILPKDEMLPKKGNRSMFCRILLRFQRWA